MSHSSERPQHIYHAIDQADTISELISLNEPLGLLQLTNVAIGADIESMNKYRIVRRTRLHKWWDSELMVCHIAGLISTPVGNSGISLPHFNPEMLTWLREQGISGVVRGYAGRKILKAPIVKGHIAGGYWNEEFCDDTRLLLPSCVMTRTDPGGSYFETLDALRDHMLDDNNDTLSRDISECMMLELLIEGIKRYHELALEWKVGTSEFIIQDPLSFSQRYGWAKLIANIRNVDESFVPQPLATILEKGSRALVTSRTEVLLDVVRSTWYDCADAVISLLKCRAVVRANEDICRDMKNALIGNQWVSTYYDCDLEDEISIEEWVRFCGFAEGMHKEFTGEMSEYIQDTHLATDTSGMKKYKGKSYQYKGLNVSRASQYEYLDSQVRPTFDLPKRKGKDEKLSLCVNHNTHDLIVVSMKYRDRLLRFLSGITVTFKSPVVDVSKTGQLKTGAGPGPTSVVKRVLEGIYGTDTILWLLSHIHMGNIWVHARSPFQGFVPKHSVSDVGNIALMAPLSGSVMGKFKVIRRKKGDKRIYSWAPYKVGNTFEISVGKTLVSLKETSEDYVDEDCVIVRLGSQKNIQ